MSNSQINKLKSGTKNGTQITFKPSSNVVGDSNDDNKVPHKLLLTNTRVLRLRKANGNGSLADIKLQETRWQKVGQSE